MCRCARVMADWSSEPKFAKELGTKEAAGRSFLTLMRSVSAKTKAWFRCRAQPTAVCRIETGRGGGCKEDTKHGYDPYPTAVYLHFFVAGFCNRSATEVT